MIYDSDSPIEGNRAIRKDRIGIPSVVEKRKSGRKRRDRSMGRYPLRRAIRSYMEANKGYLAETTYFERQRKLRALAGRYEKLRERDRTLEPDPVKWTERELTAIMQDMKKRGWSLATQRKELGNLKALLRYLGNGMLDSMKSRNPHLFPREQRKRGPCLSESSLRAILDSIDKPSNWRGEVMRFIIPMYAFSGLRMSELRLAEIGDLDTTEWKITVRNPKGKGTYGEQRMVPIVEPLRPYVTRYLNARESMLRKRGVVNSIALIPRERGDPNRFYSANQFERMISFVRKISGIKFDFRALRRTFGQNLLNRGVPIESVSLALGHANTRTTEGYYARKDPEIARLEILNAFARSERASNLKSPLIENLESFTGYA